MKLKLIIILFTIIMASTIKAQIIETTPYEFAIGASGGSTFSSITFNPKVAQGMLRGMTFGITGRITMGEYVGLQAELNFVQEGWKEQYDDSLKYKNYKYNRTINYLQLPFYTRVQFGGKNVKGFINAGPQIAYFLSESTDENLNGATPGKVHYQDTMAVEKKFEWGISGGAGLEIRTGIGFFILEGRYFYSFSDIYNTKRSDMFAKASSQVITAKLTYLIPIKKKK